MKSELSPPASPEADPVQGVRTLLTAEQIARRVKELGQQISTDYGDAFPLLVAVLRGAFVMTADLSRAITIHHEVDFLQAASYGGGTSSTGQVRLLNNLRTNIQGRHVLLVEGVVDSGLTLNYLIEQLRQREPASIKVATLLDKAPCRKVDVHLDYVGFAIGNEFVIGYGMDVAERFRNLPYVGIYSGT